MKKTFLSFLILTYRRPTKLRRLLEVFLNEEFSNSKKAEMEIIIVDDHGEDDTHDIISPVMGLLSDSGWSVKYIYRSQNLRGDRNLYEGYTKDCKGDYVWFLCDDDLIKPEIAIEFIAEIKSKQPVLALCGFQQGLDNQIKNNLGENIRCISNFNEVVYWMTKFPKTSAYVYRTCNLNLNPLIERWDRTLHSWVGIGIYIQQKIGGQLLLYPEITAEADSEYLNLQYSYRIFGKLAGVVQDCCRLLGLSFDEVQKNNSALSDCDELTLCLQGLSAHYSYRSLARYNGNVLAEEKIYLRKNIKFLLRTRQRSVATAKLVIFYLICVVQTISKRRKKL